MKSFISRAIKSRLFKIYNLLAKFINKTTQGETNNKNKNIIGDREVDNENDTYVVTNRGKEALKNKDIIGVCPHDA